MNFILNIVFNIIVHLYVLFHWFKRQTKKRILKVDRQKILKLALSIDRRVKKSMTFFISNVLDSLWTSKSE